MTIKIDTDLREQVEKLLAGGISENATTAIRKEADSIAERIISDVEWRLKDELAPTLALWVAEMAEKAVEALIAGDDGRMRSFLACDPSGFNGRSDGYWIEKDPARWHSVIHGRLFETGSLEFRKKIVNAHRDLLVTERVKDLEDQVASLVAQVAKLEREKEDLRERVR